MLIVGSENASVGIPAGRAVLEADGPVLDAVVAITREVEENTEDHTVGTGGYPNVDGVVELDASIMEGAGRRAGAVGGLRGYGEAIVVARAVMERTPHVLVTGEGAARLAAEIGLTARDLLDDHARGVWQRGIDGQLAPDSMGGRMLALVQALTSDPDVVDDSLDADHERFGTVNVLVRDAAGRIATGVSTSGWAFKLPGRLGDSPVIGAGSYCDDRYGAAACTGYGEAAIRAGVARMVVAHMSHGASPDEACGAGLSDLATLTDIPFDLGGVHVVALDARGRHAGASTLAGKQYVAWEAGRGDAELLPRAHIALT